MCSGERTPRNADIGGGLGSLGGLIVGGLGGLAGGIGTGVAGGMLMTKGNVIKLEPGTILRIKSECPVSLPAFSRRALTKTDDVPIRWMFKDKNQVFHPDPSVESAYYGGFLPNKKE